MLFHEVDLPQVVIDAQKRGTLVLFAGAGVSMDAPSSYPNFLNLATELGGTASPIEEHELIDRYLGRLVEKGIPVHERVKTRLSDPTSRPNHLHETVVRLFGSADNIRIVTTNFDDHFRGAAQTVYGAAPEIYRAPALPLGDDFKGIVHLHGSVLDDAKRLILTDADFGRAYLTQGWARRFIQQLFSRFVVVFVGYSHQDLPLLYLARGISAAEDGPGRYAITPPENDTFWLNLGIKPAHYPLRVAPLARHGALGDCLSAWAETANLGSLGTEARIKGLVTSDRPLSLEEEDFLKQALLDLHTLRYFTRHAKDTRWLQWISGTESFNAIFAPGAALSETSVELAAWFAEYFAIRHFAIAIELVREKNQTLSPSLWNAVAQAFHRQAASGAPLRLWVPILLGTMPVNGQSNFLAYMIGHSTVPEDQHSILQLFRKLVAPTLRLKRRFLLVEDRNPAVPDAEVVPIGSDHLTTHAYRKKILPHLDVFAKGLASTVALTFEEARTMLVMYEKAGPKWDPISYSRGAVASRMQDHLRNGFSTLIDAGADILRWADQHDPKYATSLIGQWIESDAVILRRLAIAGMAGRASVPADEKLSWAISNSIVGDFWLKNETFALLAEAYETSNETLRAELLAQAETVMTRAGDDHERYEFFNLLSWLHKHAPECALVTDKLQRIQERHPEWGECEHPDFNSWIGGGVRVLQPASPTPALEITTMGLDKILGESARLAEVKNTFGDPMQSGLLQEISRATAANLAWSEGIAREAVERTDIPAEIWSAFVRGWTGNHTVEEWRSVLATVGRLKPVFGSLLYELSSLLTAAVEQKEPVLPLDLLDSAFTITNAVRAVCEIQESPLPDKDDNWVMVAINRTLGHLLEFYFDALRLLWPNRQQEQERIQAILHVLETMIGQDGPTAEVARILVASKAALFADVSPDWYAAHVLPLLAMPANPRSAEQNWDGYLVWGTWTQPMLEGLLPAHLHHLPSIATASSERSSMFCRNLAGFAVFGAIDPLDSGWLGEFLTRAAHRERVHWAASVTQMLRDADEQAKESAWERWIHRYLQRRVASDPLPLHAEEAGDVCEWAVALPTHYAEIAELLVASLAPSVKGNLFYYRLQEANLLDNAPVVTARLLTVLLSQEDVRELSDIDQIHFMVSRLIDLDPTEPALRPLCERLGALGSPMALEFKGKLH